MTLEEHRAAARQVADELGKLESSDALPIALFALAYVAADYGITIDKLVDHIRLASEISASRSR